MNSTHWTARALLICAMILGVSFCYSRYLASTGNRHVNNATDLRLWMSRGQVELTRREYKPPYRLLPLEGSIWALKLFSLPKVTLNLAVLLYTVGLVSTFCFRGCIMLSQTVGVMISGIFHCLHDSCWFLCIISALLGMLLHS
jgi:hypothetical protein